MGDRCEERVIFLFKCWQQTSNLKFCVIMAKSECSFVIDDEVGSVMFSDAFELSDTLNVGMKVMSA